MRLPAAGAHYTSTLLGVAALAAPEFLIELEATAVTGWRDSQPALSTVPAHGKLTLLALAPICEFSGGQVARRRSAGRWAMGRFWARKSVRVGSVVLLVLVVAAAASVTTYLVAGRSAAETATATPAITTTESATPASLNTIKQSISVSGTLTPAVQESVNFAVSGTVTAVSVEAGQTVKKGDVLATVGTLNLESDLASAKATLASAKARLVSDQNTLADQQDSLEDASDSAADTLEAQIESTKAQITADESAVSVAESGVTTAQDNLAAATLTAPVAGLVTSVSVATGDAVTGSSSSSSSSSSNSSGSSSPGGTGFGGTPSGSGSSASSSSGAAFVIVGTSAWKVDVSVSDSQVGLLKVGNQVQIRESSESSSMTSTAGGFPFGGFPGGTGGGFPGGAGGGFPDFGGGGFPGQNGGNGNADTTTQNADTSTAPTFFGTVASIGLISSSSGGTASYPVVVNVTGEKTDLHDGTSVTAEIIYKQLTNVLTVPTSAITTSGGVSTVTVVAADGTKTPTTVTTGAASDGQTQILSGLAEGDEVQVTTVTFTGRGGEDGTTGNSARTGNSGRTGSGRTGGGGFPSGGTVPSGGVPGAGGN